MPTPMGVADGGEVDDPMQGREQGMDVEDLADAFDTAAAIVAALRKAEAEQAAVYQPPLSSFSHIFPPPDTVH